MLKVQPDCSTFVLQGVHVLVLAAEGKKGVAGCWDDIKTDQESLGMFSFVDPAFHSNLVRAVIGPPGTKVTGPDQKEVDYVVSSKTLLQLMCYHWYDDHVFDSPRDIGLCTATHSMGGSNVYRV